jgi:hypothetical protein
VRRIARRNHQLVNPTRKSPQLYCESCSKLICATIILKATRRCQRFLRWITTSASSSCYRQRAFCCVRLIGAVGWLGVPMATPVVAGNPLPPAALPPPAAPPPPPPMPWATAAKAIIEVTSKKAANVFDIMALFDFLNGASYPVQAGIAAPTICKPKVCCNQPKIFKLLMGQILTDKSVSKRHVTEASECPSMN